MPAGPIPGHGAHGAQPFASGGRADGPGRDRPDDRDGWDERLFAGDDFDADAHLAALVADTETGRISVPGHVQGLTVSVPGLEHLGTLDTTGFTQGEPADVMPAGTLLAALADNATADLAALDDGQLLGLASAGRRLAARGAWTEATAVGEFAARRQAAVASGDRGAKARAEYAAVDVAMELLLSDHQAAEKITIARALRRRLPRTSAALAAGLLDEYKAKIIAETTAPLTDKDAAQADEILAAAAPVLRYGQLWNQARRVAAALDPEAAARKKEEAKGNARVYRFREPSGLAGISARDMSPEDILAAWQHITTRARAMRAAGVPGSMQVLYARAFADLLTERGPVADLAARNGPPGTGTSTADTDAAWYAADAADADFDGEPFQPAPGGDENEESDQSGCGDASEDSASEDSGTAAGQSGNTASRPQRAPVAALINITVPASTAWENGTQPGYVAGFGDIDAESARNLLAMAAGHPQTRWCVTVIGADGTAQAHGCAAGRHPYDPGIATKDPNQHRTGGGERDGPASPPDTASTGTGGSRTGQQTAQQLRRLGVELALIAKGTCDHARRQDRHDPSRLLRHIIWARQATCPAPGCGADAIYNDIDHTVPHDQGGATCEENLSPPCRRHHKVKQIPGWNLRQDAPGEMIWTTPTGRQYRTGPTRYDRTGPIRYDR
jgi:hypothetical protein